MIASERIVLAVSLIASGVVGFGLQRWGGIDFPALMAGPRGGKRGSGGKIGRDVSGLPASIWFVCGAMVFLSSMFGPPIAASLPAQWTGAMSSQMHGLVSSACGLGLGIAAALFLLYMIQPRVGPAAGTRLAWRDVPLGVLAAACIAPFYLAASTATQWFVRDVLGQPVPELAHSSLREFVQAPWSPTGLMIGLTAVVLAPFVEECIYRLFITSCLMRLFAGETTRGIGTRTVGLAVLTTSAGFAAIHAAGGGPVPWAAVPGLFVLALGLGIAFEKTRRLGVPMVAHGLFNLANLALAVVVSRGAWR